MINYQISERIEPLTNRESLTSIPRIANNSEWLALAPLVGGFQRDASSDKSLVYGSKPTATDIWLEKLSVVIEQ